MRISTKFLFIATLMFAASHLHASPTEIVVNFQDFVFRSSTERCGILLVERNGKTEKKRIYKAKKNECLWIEDMYSAIDRLMILDESGRVFELHYKAFIASPRTSMKRDDFFAAKRRIEELKRKHRTNSNQLFQSTRTSRID